VGNALISAGRIRVGMGGWTYEPWRETFYPADVPKARELHYASRQVTAIEVNGTFYRLQKPETFAKWRDQAPADFVFSIKAPRYLSQRKSLAEAGGLLGRFMDSGLAELGDKLGPILWQFLPSLKFDAADAGSFLDALPRELGGRRLRHALEPRHASFQCAEFVELAWRHGAGLVFTDAEGVPSFEERTADFMYARLKRTEPEVETGYAAGALEGWAAKARQWAEGGDVFMYFIDGAKERAPAAARALLSALGNA
jgi:uncharacterized protein YecE (DUF72 family)